MATLVEQLLDLSRLDAEAIEIAPERVRVRSQVEEIVNVAAPDRAEVEIDVPEDTFAHSRPSRARPHRHEPRHERLPVRRRRR